MDCQKNTIHNITHEIAVIKKLMKTRKELGTTYCLESKDYTHNFKSQKVKMKNKVPREKLNCVVCRSSKPRFLKKFFKK